MAVSLRELGPVSKQISPNHADGKGWLNRMLEALGTTSTDFIVTELSRVMNAVGASGEGGEAKANAVLAVIDGIRPRNEVEAMLVSQMAVTHHLAMEVLGCARRVTDIQQFDSAANAASKLLQTYIMQLDALTNMRRGGKQEVRVVHVHAGAQAVIGDVTSHARGRGSKKNAHQPHAAEPSALAFAPRREVRCVDTARNGVPVTGSDKKGCRMHGGAPGSGAPSGPRNGNYRHGQRTQKAMAERRALREWIKVARSFVDKSARRDPA